MTISISSIQIYLIFGFLFAIGIQAFNGIIFKSEETNFRDHIYASIGAIFCGLTWPLVLVIIVLMFSNVISRYISKRIEKGQKKDEKN